MTPGSRALLAGQPWLLLPATRRIIDALGADGGTARFVGGCVRDSLLGTADEATDIDVATTELPKRVQDLLADADIRSIPTGLQHGTITAIIGGRPFEITTLRRDVDCDGRRAEVAFTDDFDEDAARRDFTVNAMSCDIEGRLFDPFGGRRDLDAGRIRFVGDPDRRIREDYLRILRYFRFHAQIGRGDADPTALAACARHAAGIDRLSGERVQTEFMRLLAATDPRSCLELMMASGVLDRVVGDAVSLARLKNLLAGPLARPLLRLAALVRPPPAVPRGAERIAARLRLSNRDGQRLVELTCLDLPPPDLPEAALDRLLYNRDVDLVGDLVLMARADDPDCAPAFDRMLARMARWTRPNFPLGGADLIAAGVAPGPAMGELLAAIESWWIARDFTPDSAACLAHLSRLLTAPPDSARS